MRYPVQHYFLDQLEGQYPTLAGHSAVKEALRSETTEACSLSGPMTRVLVQLIKAVASVGVCVLVFLPGIGEIETVQELLLKLRTACPLKILPLHSLVPAAQQVSLLGAFVTCSFLQCSRDHSVTECVLGLEKPLQFCRVLRLCRGRSTVGNREKQACVLGRRGTVWGNRLEMAAVEWWVGPLGFGDPAPWCSRHVSPLNLWPSFIASAGPHPWLRWFVDTAYSRRCGLFVLHTACKVWA